METAEARELFVTATVARMATVGSDAAPHLVPLVFALLPGDRIVSAVDHKPKRSTALRRLANIAANPRVSLLADRYSDDWVSLWWVRADGRARILAPGQEEQLREQAIAALVARYVQYEQQRPHGELIVVDVERWSGWRG